MKALEVASFKNLYLSCNVLTEGQYWAVLEQHHLVEVAVIRVDLY